VYVAALAGAILCAAAIALAAPMRHVTSKAQNSAASAVASDRYFEFHSGFWINLHLFLYEEAAVRSAAPDRRREAEATSDSAISAAFGGDEKASWDAAVAYYQANLISLDLLTNDRMRTIKNSLEDLESATTLVHTRLDPALVRVLDHAAPVYRAHWWAAHDRANRDWIAAAIPMVDADGVALSTKIPAAYNSAWPEAPLRVDVSAYANWSGAYTTLHPDRILISSLDLRNQKLAALEILFHEASHTMIESVASLLIQDFASRRKTAPADLWHAIIFFTTGHYVKAVHPDYVTYADQEGLWKQGKWPLFEAALVKDWEPHLDGKSPLPAAVSQLVADVVSQKNP